jgi:Fur family ferric uptake transcriptional regulator
MKMMDCERTRLTKQRRVVLEELKKTTAHPTADELYEVVRKRLPNISLGTVYRNLEILSACGEALKLDLGEGKKRFDARMEPHYHLRCTECGRVFDIPYIPLDDEIKSRLKDVSQYKITGIQVHFDGICDECMKKVA